MSDSENPRDGEPKKPDSLGIRAQFPPVARINRKVLVGAIALGLLGLAGIIIVAFDPPRLAPTKSPEHITPTKSLPPEALARLPASYDALPRPAPAPNPLVTAEAQTSTPFPEPGLGSGSGANDDARKSPIFFRLALKPPFADAAGAKNSSSTPLSHSMLSSAGPATALNFPTPSFQRSTEVGIDQNRITVGAASASNSSTSRQPFRNPGSPYTVMAGTVIAASLLTGLNSDLPGFVIAQTTENVYDTVTGQHLLIPQGTRLLGTYDSRIAYGQDRALVVWQRLIRPDGSAIEIDNLPATDAGGYTGLADQVDRKTWELIKGIALATVFGVGTELAFREDDNTLISALRRATQTTTNTAGDKLIGKGLIVKPTLTVRPGWPLRVIVHKDLILAPYAPPTETRLTR